LVAGVAVGLSGAFACRQACETFQFNLTPGNSPMKLRQHCDMYAQQAPRAVLQPPGPQGTMGVPAAPADQFHGECRE
jgi:hypothetical protein